MTLIRTVARFTTVLAFAGLGQGAYADEWTEVAPEDVGMSTERLERLTNVFQGYVDNGDMAGAVILVARNGAVPYFETFGVRDVESQAPMEEDTIFRIASMSKAVITTAIMIAQEEGLLLIGDPVGDYLPEWMETTVAVENGAGGYDIVPAERPITIRDLITHTSGLAYGGGIAADQWEAAGITGWYFGGFDEPIREVVRRMAALPMDAHPGTEWIYGYSIDVLGAVVEEASGETLDVYLQTRLFDPLGMDDTQFYLPEAEADRLATVYSRDDTEGLSRAPDASAMDAQGEYIVGQGPNMAFSGGAGLLSTAHDYSVFLQMFLNEGRTMGGEQILSPKTIELMTQSHLGDIPFRDGAGFGLGFQIAEDRGEIGDPGSVGEFRWGGAYNTTYWVDPEENMLVTYFTQLRPRGDIDDQAKLRTMIYQAVVE